eukprot:CAMPEP_0178407400 /NCGR_PEP_ID=MMETSP0689_2-20121128/19411_1 /TAXON_ID=160604 /ORGANISM="Amphidinium massartii, Strain CS-259" /LENGTH=380 /DNA_ID=CAMNT_0020028477 /DNA_START=74 /DNA_END=1213 /DNA_ORIENTATION=-
MAASIHTPAVPLRLGARGRLIASDQKPRPSSECSEQLLLCRPATKNTQAIASHNQFSQAVFALAAGVIVGAARASKLRFKRSKGRSHIACRAQGGQDKGAGAKSEEVVMASKGTEIAAKASPAESRAQLEAAGKEYSALNEDQRSAVSGIFFPDAEELDMDKAMPLEDHFREAREGLIRAGIAVVLCVGACLYFYKPLTAELESPALSSGLVKFVQLGPGEFFFVSLKASAAIGLLLAFPYVLFEAAVYLAPALTRTERGILGPVVLGSGLLFYAGTAFAFFVLSPAALGFFLSYSEGVIESQFSIDQYFEFILSMGFATGLAFQVPILQVVLGYLGVLRSEQLFSVWRYVVVGSAVAGAILTPSTDPVTQLLLSGALCF